MQTSEMRQVKAPTVYVMANRYRGTICVGVTGLLWYRVRDHKNKRFDGFTKDYGLKTLV
jgi:putative endonuclease